MPVREQRSNPDGNGYIPISTVMAMGNANDKCNANDFGNINGNVNGNGKSNG